MVIRLPLLVIRVYGYSSSNTSRKYVGKKEYFVHDETDAPYEKGNSPYRKGEEDDLYLPETAQMTALCYA